MWRSNAVGTSNPRATLDFGLARLLFLILFAGATGASNAQPERMVFAHYMPEFANQMDYARQANPYHPNAVGKDNGGRLRDAPLLARSWFRDKAPWGDGFDDFIRYEIRLAIRTGVNGFIFDYGGGYAQKGAASDSLHISLNVIGRFFDVAEKEFPGFKLALALDQAAGGGNYERRLVTIRQFLERHGKSLNLARQGGKPVFFSYRATALEPSKFGLTRQVPEKAFLDNQADVIANWKRIWAEIGEPVFFVADIYNAWQYGHLGLSDKAIERMVSMWAEAFDGLSVFGATDSVEQATKLYPSIARACAARGRIFMAPVWWGYHRTGDRILMGGSEILQKTWQLARETKAPWVQIVTWNDFTEQSNWAPSIGRGYVLSELGQYFIEWHKSGRPPAIKADEIYVFYRRYAGAPASTDFPTKSKPWLPLSDQLEVLTLTTGPARLVVENYGEANVPAGMYSTRFPLKEGSVTAALTRGKAPVAEVRGLTPVVGRPYREMLDTYAASSSFNRLFRDDTGFDFSATDPRWADADRNGVADWVQFITADERGKVFAR